ncbi:MAG: hypothetical protein L0H79_02330, partial [Intrasporangium sp.]|uniref:hypothetical protein n=1 Tax=Intrasporangium sp. TaxID=1925024 RepID=UPI0026479A26
MGSVVRAAALAGSATMAALLLQGSAPSASADAHGSGARSTRTFHVLFSPPSYTDLGPAGFSAADVIVFHDQLQRGSRT